MGKYSGEIKSVKLDLKTTMKKAILLLSLPVFVLVLSSCSLRREIQRDDI